MQKIRPLILVAAMSVAGTVTAATVDVVVGGVTTNYTLMSMSVDSGGNVTVNASGGTTTGGGDTGGGDTGGGDTGGGDTGGGDTGGGGTGGGDTGGGTDTSGCATPGAEVIQVATSMPDSSYPSTMFKPAPSTVYAFKFGTVASGTKVGGLTATKTSSALVSKTVVVSACPGSPIPVDAGGGCIKSGTEAAKVGYSVNKPDLNTRYYCPLQPGKTYYANVFSKNDLADTKYNCSNTTNCSVYFNGY